MPPMCCLPTAELLDAPLPSPGSSSVQVPRLPRYYQDAMTSCRPSRRTSLPSLGGTTQALVFRPLTAERCRGRVSWSWSPGTSGRELVSGDGRISYVPGEPQLCSCPALRPRQDPRIRPYDASARPPLCPRRRLPQLGFRGSITRLRHWLSTLRRPGHPDTTQDSLPAAGQALPDGLDYPQGSIERFHDVSYMRSSFPKFNAAQGQSHFRGLRRENWDSPRERLQAARFRRRSGPGCCIAP